MPVPVPAAETSRSIDLAQVVADHAGDAIAAQRMLDRCFHQQIEWAVANGLVSDALDDLESACLPSHVLVKEMRIEFQSRLGVDRSVSTALGVRLTLLPVGVYSSVRYQEATIRTMRLAVTIQQVHLSNTIHRQGE